MESMRQQYNKVIQAEIRQLERFREQAEKRSSEQNIERFVKRIEELGKELEEDTPRYEAFVSEQQEMSRHQKKSQQGKILQMMQDSANKTKLDGYYKEENRIRRNDRYLQHQMKREWEWLCAQDARLPDYMRTNLAKMPNNKGYIWKGIWYFGHLEEEDRNNLVMFERNNGEFFIHEIRYGRYHKVFCKDKNGKTTLVREEIYENNRI
jgi:hypothetical protein